MKKQETKRTSSQNKDAQPLYRQSENVQELLDQLRDLYISYKESTMRCNVEFKSTGNSLIPLEQYITYNFIGNSDNLKYFYFPPKVPLLEEPEKQKIFRKNFIQELASVPEPEPLTLIADSLQYKVLDTIADRSNPTI